MKYSIHRALGMLKTLDSRIYKGIVSDKFIGVKKNSTDKEYDTGLLENEFKNKAIAAKQSVDDLIEQRKEIKEAIVHSNAITKVFVASVEMTVASAIELKDSIKYKKTLLDEYKKQYNNAVSFVQRKNDAIEDTIDEKIDILAGGDSVLKNTGGMSDFAKKYREDNSWKAIDPLGLKDIIENLENEIVNFENEVDIVLSESNATTFIEIEESKKEN